jgi:hypothetical protein
MHKAFLIKQFKRDKLSNLRATLNQGVKCKVLSDKCVLHVQVRVDEML